MQHFSLPYTLNFCALKFLCPNFHEYILVYLFSINIFPLLLCLKNSLWVYVKTAEDMLQFVTICTIF